MSRVIKFRAWDDIRKRMMTSAKWVEFRFNSKGRLDAVNFNPKGGLQNLDLMQFTGFTDKNGVDIYEGDIVAFLCEYKDEPNRQVLFDVDFLTYTILSKQEKEWVDGGSNHYKYCRQEGNTELYFLNDLDSYELEVVGNIYENKDLLQ